MLFGDSPRSGGAASTQVSIRSRTPADSISALYRRAMTAAQRANARKPGLPAKRFLDRDRLFLAVSNPLITYGPVRDLARNRAGWQSVAYTRRRRGHDAPELPMFFRASESTRKQL